MIEKQRYGVRGRSGVEVAEWHERTTPILSSTSSIVETPVPLPRMYPRVSVVIPARNEARNLVHVVPHLPSCVSEVILVDGNSTDNTIQVAQALLPSIRVVCQAGRGKGDALRLGFAESTGDIIVMLDADGSADPGEIPLFVAALVEGGYDFAKGSRFLKGGGSHDITHFRRIGNHGLSLLVNLLFWTHFSDLCYGYNAFWRHCLDTVAIDCDGFEVETLLNLRMHSARFNIIEIPSFEHPRIYGESNLRALRDGWRVLKTIGQEWRVSLRTAPVKRVPTRANIRPITAKSVAVSVKKRA